ncbi:MAG TPA: TonB-dependent receptor [Terriglobia bacterium]|nr:TonB-dependent receptor [Terriglobia bacterium]
MGMDQTAVSQANFQPILGTQEKALAINLDASKFGTFAEIGAGQEVARWFFHVGHASATVAKSMSAYDMVISDIIYGPTDHYVSRARLDSMLDHEWEQLIERLDPVRGERTSFFVFADTVATRSRSRHQDGQGWLGIRFQAEPKSPYSEIIFHVNLLDQVPVSEQEALGILGVNLVYGAFHQRQPEELMKALMEGLSRQRVDIDMIKFSGPAFRDVDNRLASLQLVELELTDATMFTAQGEVVQPAEVLYNKPVLILRGRFRPITNVELDMLNSAADRFKKIPDVNGEPVVLMGMTLQNLGTGPGIDRRDFLDRADILGALGKTVMVSNYTRFDSVTSLLRRYTRQWLGFVMGLPTLRAVFDEQYYTSLPGGILEGLGRLFQGNVRLYVYPTRARSGEVATSTTLEVDPQLQHLLDYLRERGEIEALENFDSRQLHMLPDELLTAIQNGTPGWEQYLPPQAAEVIKQRALFGYRQPVGLGT